MNLIIRPPKENRTRFDAISDGEIFEFNEKFFLKVRLVTGTDINAVDLNNMIASEFPDNVLVHPLNAELILTEKEG